MSRQLIFLTILYLILTVPVLSQLVRPNQLPTNSDLARTIQWREIRRSLDDLDGLGKIKTSQPPDPRSDSIILDTLYRRSKDSELALLAPEKDDRNKFSAILSKPGTGMVKLIRDFGCDEYSSAAYDEKLCTKFSMPGGGSAFSFRQADYQFWKLADILYDGRSFMAFGQMSLGLMVDLGNAPFESVGLDSKGMAYLVSFVPKGEMSDASTQNTALADGITDNGFTYKKFLPVVVGDTYVIRSVAFRGKVPRQHYEQRYNELDFDRRKDIIAAFQVVRQDFNGTVTIVWKVLQTKQSPELKINK